MAFGVTAGGLRSELHFDLAQHGGGHQGIMAYRRTRRCPAQRCDTGRARQTPQQEYNWQESMECGESGRDQG